MTRRRLIFIALVLAGLAVINGPGVAIFWAAMFGLAWLVRRLWRR